MAARGEVLDLKVINDELLALEYAGDRLELVGYRWEAETEVLRETFREGVPEVPGGGQLSPLARLVVPGQPTLYSH
jgi:hypothetical protein